MDEKVARDMPRLNLSPPKLVEKRFDVAPERDSSLSSPYQAPAPQPVSSFSSPDSAKMRRSRAAMINNENWVLSDLLVPSDLAVDEFPDSDSESSCDG